LTLPDGMATARFLRQPMSASPPTTRLGTALRKLLTVLSGIALFLVAVGFLGVWALGRFSPKFLDASLATKSGAHLAVEANDTNLFAGRIAYEGLTITNPTRWTEREFLKVRRLAVDLELLTFFEGGSQTVNRAELDIEHLTIVGKADFLADNNAKDIFNGLKASSAGPSPSPAPKPPAGKQPFLIKHLRVRVDRITVIAGDGTPERKVVVDQPFGYVFEARDITERNFDEKVSRPMGTQAVRTAAERQPELLLDLARERVRRSVTEKLLGEK
jgi:hypothetical protein